MTGSVTWASSTLSGTSANTSPCLSYQFWLNAPDTDAEKWIKIFTFLPPGEVAQLQQQHSAAPEARLLQKPLARAVTTFVHGEEGYKAALADTEKLFANQSAPVESLTVEYFETLQGVSRFDYSLSRIDEGVDVVSFLAETGVFPSKGEARKLIQGGGVSINRKKVEDVKLSIDKSMLLQNKYILVQRGKSNHYLVNII